MPQNDRLASRLAGPLFAQWRCANFSASPVAIGVSNCPGDVSRSLIPFICVYATATIREGRRGARNIPSRLFLSAREWDFTMSRHSELSFPPPRFYVPLYPPPRTGKREGEEAELARQPRFLFQRRAGSKTQPTYTLSRPLTHFPHAPTPFTVIGAG